MPQLLMSVNILTYMNITTIRRPFNGQYVNNLLLFRFSFTIHFHQRRRDAQYLHPI
jgi:hypothetical protein